MKGPLSSTSEFNQLSGKRSRSAEPEFDLSMSSDDDFAHNKKKPKMDKPTQKQKTTYD